MKPNKSIKLFSEPSLNFTSFTDVLFNFLLVFIIIITLLKVKQDATPSLPPNVMYQLVMDWEGSSKTDMDLWAKDSQGKLVGFNNREGGENSLFSLAHDDLGSRNDVINIPSTQPSLNNSIVPTPPNSFDSSSDPNLSTLPKSVTDAKVVLVNQEIISMRGTREGEYVVNGHCYSKSPNTPPDKVRCKLVKIKPFKEIKSIERVFKTNGDEITFFRFKVDKDGNVLEVNELPQKIVTLNKEADVDEPPNN